MIDDVRIQSLIEKITVVQESAEKSYTKFHEILDFMNVLSGKVNGYPAKTVEMLQEIQDKLDYLEISIINEEKDLKEVPKGSSKFWYCILILFLVTLGSFLGTILQELIFQN